MSLFRHFMASGREKRLLRGVHLRTSSFLVSLAMIVAACGGRDQLTEDVAEPTGISAGSGTTTTAPPISIEPGAEVASALDDMEDPSFPG